MFKNLKRISAGLLLLTTATVAVAGPPGGARTLLLYEAVGTIDIINVPEGWVVIDGRRYQLDREAPVYKNLSRRESGSVFNLSRGAQVGFRDAPTGRDGARQISELWIVGD